MTPLERKAIIKTHPRVRFHAEAAQCTALTTARSGIGTYWHKDLNIRAAKQAHARCKNVAHWRFTSLKKSWASDGDYCWNHLFSQGLMADMTEDAAFRTWSERRIR